jgi:hypothetical protein
MSHPQFEVMGDLKGKVEQVKFLNLDLTDQVLFPQVNIEFFWSISLDELGGMQFIDPDFMSRTNEYRLLTDS